MAAPVCPAVNIPRARPSRTHSAAIRTEARRFLRIGVMEGSSKSTTSSASTRPMRSPRVGEPGQLGLDLATAPDEERVEAELDGGGHRALDDGAGREVAAHRVDGDRHERRAVPSPPTRTRSPPSPRGPCSTRRTGRRGGAAWRRRSSDRRRSASASGSRARGAGRVASCCVGASDSASNLSWLRCRTVSAGAPSGPSSGRRSAGRRCTGRRSGPSRTSGRGPGTPPGRAPSSESPVEAAPR